MTSYFHIYYLTSDCSQRGKTHLAGDLNGDGDNDEEEDGASDKDATRAETKGSTLYLVFSSSVLI